MKRAWCVVIGCLILGIAVRAGDDAKVIAFLKLVQERNVEEVKKSLAADKTLANAATTKTNAIYLAAIRGHDDVVKVLVENGADFKGKNALAAAAGQSPAALRDEQEAKKEADPSSPVHKSKKAIVEYLIEKGADVNAKDQFGETPIFSAVAADFKDIVEVLIKAKADVNAVNGSSLSVLKYATVIGRDDIANLLKQNGAK